MPPARNVLNQAPGGELVWRRADGDLSSVTAPAKYTQVPESTSARTVELARQLAAGTTSTYDTILAIQQWLHEHVEYDLDAPVPPDGAMKSRFAQPPPMPKRVPPRPITATPVTPRAR